MIQSLNKTNKLPLYLRHTSFLKEPLNRKNVFIHTHTSRLALINAMPFMSMSLKGYKSWESHMLMDMKIQIMDWSNLTRKVSLYKGTFNYFSRFLFHMQHRHHRCVGNLSYHFFSFPLLHPQFKKKQKTKTSDLKKMVLCCSKRSKLMAYPNDFLF